jgi:hypothetical protein
MRDGMDVDPAQLHGGNDMQGRCNSCGKQATQTCECGGCERFMCEEHTTRRAPPAMAVAEYGQAQRPRGQTFCPEHAYLADPLNM